MSVNHRKHEDVNCVVDIHSKLQKNKREFHDERFSPFIKDENEVKLLLGRKDLVGLNVIPLILEEFQRLYLPQKVFNLY